MFVDRFDLSTSHSEKMLFAESLTSKQRLNVNYKHKQQIQKSNIEKLYVNDILYVYWPIFLVFKLSSAWMLFFRAQNIAASFRRANRFPNIHYCNREQCFSHDKLTYHEILANQMKKIYQLMHIVVLLRQV